MDSTADSEIINARRQRVPVEPGILPTSPDSCRSLNGNIITIKFDGKILPELQWIFSFFRVNLMVDCDGRSA
jgi:hypothetical protein